MQEKEGEGRGLSLSLLFLAAERSQKRKRGRESPALTILSFRERRWKRGRIAEGDVP